MTRPHPTAEALAELAALNHPDPHSILGAHEVPGGIAVRAWRPEAKEVRLLRQGEPPISLAATRPEGLFEVLVSASERFAYRLEVVPEEGPPRIVEDPYRFWPTLGDIDLHLIGEGRHERLYEKLGAHVRTVEGVTGVSFAVWAPCALGVSVVGMFNGWDGRLHMMRRLGASGVWEIFVPEVSPGDLYKFEVRSATNEPMLKSDPMAVATEVPPGTASIVYESKFVFDDADWLARRAASEPIRQPISIYEVHLASWRRVPEEDDRPLSYREAASALAEYVGDLGFTHVELLPITEHPFGGSWGYQTTSYYAPTSRLGEPDDLRFLVNELHRHGIGVILDWAPAHFPRDAWALARFDGTALYEHLDPRLGEHPDWGTLVFNYGRHEVRNFLLASALFWLREFHIDGLRLDAVASMLYLDYSRSEGEWIPNVHGGRENLDAVEFLRELNEATHREHSGCLMIAEESTAWPGVSRPTYLGGLGFGFKWNMGWMHDVLEYFSKDPVFRRYHHTNLTFGLLYAWSENFVLPFSHDEVVHGKRSLLEKMPGDEWQRFANLRSLYGFMWAHPGKKLLFMGGEFGQHKEWNHDTSLDWHLIEQPPHGGLQQLVRDLNRIYRQEPALWEADGEPAGFTWLDVHNADENVIAFLRSAPEQERDLVCVCNLSPVPRYGYRVPLPRLGRYVEVLNTDSALYGGSNIGNAGAIEAEPVAWNNRAASAPVTLPPLSTLWFSLTP